MARFGWTKAQLEELTWRQLRLFAFLASEQQAQEQKLTAELTGVYAAKYLGEILAKVIGGR